MTKDLQNNQGIYNALEHGDFSRNADLSQLIKDWPRLSHVIHINGQPLSKLFEDRELHFDEETDIQDHKVQADFKKVLDMLLPKSLSSQHNEDIYQQLSSVLHQGGLLASLETQIVKTLTDSGRMLDSVKKNMSRRVDLNTTETGFSVKELFIYNGNISQRNPDEPEFVQKPNASALLTGKCEYDVVVDKVNIATTLKEMLISTKESGLEKILEKGPLMLKSQTIKQGLKELISSQPSAIPAVDDSDISDGPKR